MSIQPLFPTDKTIEVRDACLCLHVNRAARVLARHFDKVFMPLGITNGQYSLMMALNRRVPPTIGEVAPFLGIDRTSLTAMLKPMTQRGLIAMTRDAEDRRKRRLALTQEGHALLGQAFPLWKQAHKSLEQKCPDADYLRAALTALALGE